MALNIKNDHVCELAKRAAEVTGKSQVSVIEEALQRLLDAHTAGPAGAKLSRAERIADAARRFREGLSEEQLAAMDIDDLYDEQTGLPR